MFYTNKERLAHLASIDIKMWLQYNFIYNGGKCPTCDINFYDMHPETNMYPHWKGECKE